MTQRDHCPFFEMGGGGSLKGLLSITMNGRGGDAQSFPMMLMSYLFKTMMKDKHLKP